MSGYSSFYTRVGKRLIDTTLALSMMLIFSWLFLLIVLVYLISFQFPIFYFQERIGMNNKSFTLIKFRTLLTDQTLPLQQRTFWWGKFLRYWSLDELPQLWNVLKGEMALVGPRPLPVAYLELMTEQQKQRHIGRPGVTGLAQVNGRHSISWEKKFGLDNDYVNRISGKLDLFILFKTIVLLLTFREDNSLQEEEFKGNA